MRHFWALLLVPVLACAKPGASEDINAPFLDPNLDPKTFVERFEGESREIAKHHEAIADTLGLRPGDVVADVGAGTGLFLETFSRRVGPSGRVLAIDISPRLVEYMAERARIHRYDNVEARLCTERSIEAPDAAVDVVFVCDTYHHFEYPMETLASIHRALKPGGRLYIVDFERIPGKSREWILEHVRCGEETVIAESVAAGFSPLDPLAGPPLEENYFIGFVKR
jgi:predicted methyltransferase